MRHIVYDEPRLEKAIEIPLKLNGCLGKKICMCQIINKCVLVMNSGFSLHHVYNKGTRVVKTTWLNWTCV